MEVELIRLLTEQAVRDANVLGNVKGILARMQTQVKKEGGSLAGSLPESLTKEPERHWSSLANNYAVDLARKWVKSA